MNIRQITADMDDEDRNVTHSQNAMEYFRNGDLNSAAAEVALDRGFSGTFGEWLVWAEKAEANRIKKPTRIIHFTPLPPNIAKRNRDNDHE